MDFDRYPPFEGFPKECVGFLKQLKRNNNREWFEKHKEEYERNVKAPMLSFIAALQPHFARFAPEFDLNPKRSIFRIYRDVRFSSDKTPYKTHVAAHFVLRGMPKGFIGSGYYIQFEPGEFFVGGGIYLPDGNQLLHVVMNFFRSLRIVDLKNALHHSTGQNFSVFQKDMMRPTRWPIG
jgi:uncharacterized protein (TIGR02453 family)